MASGGKQSKHEPTEESRRYVRAMAGYGLRQEDIAHILEITVPTLRKHYRAQLDSGKSQAKLAIAKGLYDKAKAGNVTAMIFWLKTQAKWSERQEVTGADGEQLQAPGTVVILPEKKQE